MGFGEVKEVAKGQTVPCQEGSAKDSVAIYSITIAEQL